MDLTRIFEPISLRDLTTRASMLERVDNKYIVKFPALQAILLHLRDDFAKLEIDGTSRFTYETCYFDGNDNESYFDHLRGRRRRAKVRIRRYKDANLCFLELKIKDKRGGTIKKRLPYDLEQFGVINQLAVEYINSAYHETYGLTFPYELRRTLDVHYQRMCLVSKFGGERLTIDGSISFVAGRHTHYLKDDTFIIETKSAKGNGHADKILRKLHQHPTQNCSKYCVGMSVMNTGLKCNTFRPALRRLVG
jgi:hypothetical protein